MAKSKLSLFLVLMIAVLAAYSPALKAGFNSLDDQFSIINNEHLRNPDNLSKVFLSSFFNDTHYYRPMVEASFLLEYQAVQLNPFIYHLDNIIIHGLNACLVFILLGGILRNQTAAFAGALLFALHPIQSEAVVNIAGRSILLSAFFSFLSFIFFIQLRKHRGKLFYYLLSLVTFLASLMCKESAAMLPLLFVSYALFIDRSRGESPLIGILSAVPYFVLLAAFIVFRQTLGISELYHWDNIYDLSLGFASFLRGVITYLRLLIFPVGLYFDRSQEIFVSVFQPAFLLTIVFWWIVIRTLIISRRKFSPVTKFFMTWFALELVPVSQIITTIGVSPGYISLAEHFLYIASIGFYGVVVIVGQKIYEWMKEEKILSSRIFQISVSGVMTFLFLMTVSQSIYAGNIAAMYKRSVLMNPNNSRVLMNWGLELAKQGKFQQAEHAFRRASMLDPRPKIRIALGKSLCDQGEYLECLDEYNSVVNAGADKDLLKENKRATYKIILQMAKDYDQKGDLKNASLYYERYLSSGQGNVSEIINRLEKINASLY